jgi:hypothetical protein
LCDSQSSTRRAVGKPEVEKILGVSSAGAIAPGPPSGMRP